VPTVFHSCFDMDRIPALIWILLCYSVQTNCLNTDVIKYSAANTSILRDERNGLLFAKFVKLQNTSLNVIPSKLFMVKNESVCLVSCLQHFHCVSTNFAKIPDSNGQHECQLLEAAMFQTPQNVINNTRYNHLTIQVSLIWCWLERFLNF